MLNEDKIPVKAIEVCQILQKAGFEAYLVGGCVRDLILNSSPKDYDICTNAKPEKVIELFPKNYPTGLQHGTITVSMGEGIENHFEVTTFRVESQYSDGRRPDEVKFVMDITEDLARRDLTINAIAYDPVKNLLVDPFNGVEDLENGIIKAVGDPNVRFQEDGLRIMRVARFASRFGYQVDAMTIEGMKNNLETLSKISKERINDELSKTLMAKNPNVGLNLLAQTGALKIASPLTDSFTPLHIGMHTTEKPEFNVQNNWTGALETRLCLLYLNKAPEKIEQELISLKFATKQIKRVMFLNQLYWRYRQVRLKHDYLLHNKFIATIKNSPIDEYEYTLKEFINLTGPLGLRPQEWLEEYADEVVYSRKEMQINGDVLIGMGMPKGSQIKQALDFCYDIILEESKHNTKEMLVSIVQRKYSL